MDTIDSWRIKAVAFDLDGTLLTSAKKITPLAIDMIHRIMDLGIMAIVATGRSLATSKRFVEQIGTRSPVICYNGSCIHDLQTGKELLHNTLDGEICRDLVRLGRTAGIPLHAFMNHDLYFGPEGRHADYLEPLSSEMGREVDFDTMDSLRFTKAMFIGPLAQTEAIRKELSGRYGDTLHMVHSAPEYFEILPAGATKGDALRILLETKGIAADQTMAFGDADNDMEMLSWARHGVAMGNADDRVKKVATCVARSNDEDGVGRVLQHIFNPSGSV